MEMDLEFRPEWNRPPNLPWPPRSITHGYKSSHGSANPGSFDLRPPIDLTAARDPIVSFDLSLPLLEPNQQQPPGGSHLCTEYVCNYVP
jgi:hypothetical protein